MRIIQKPPLPRRLRSRIAAGHRQDRPPPFGKSDRVVLYHTEAHGARYRRRHVKKRRFKFFTKCAEGDRIHWKQAPVAQWIEHQIPVLRAGGSSPFRRAKKIREVPKRRLPVLYSIGKGLESRLLAACRGNVSGCSVTTPQSASQTGLAAARSRRGSDLPPAGHSIPRRRFATPYTGEPL